MFELSLDDDLKLRIFHPDDTDELFALLERNRERLRPWIHPSSLPETPRAARAFAIECDFNSFERFITKLTFGSRYAIMMTD